MLCTECGNDLPKEKFNLESFSPTVCFSCRIGSISIGFGGHRETFHGDHLHGGTIASDNRHTVEAGRANGLDPVPVKAAEAGWTPGSSQIEKLKTALGG